MAKDFAFVVDQDVPAAAVEAAIMVGIGDLAEDVHLFDVFTGEQIGEGKKSLAFAVRLRSTEGTLTAEQIGGARRRCTTRTTTVTSQKLTLAKLFTAQLFSGAGIASGYAVGGLLAEQITGRTAMAGFAQMSVILGAGLVAYPLSTLASRFGRRTALTLGFGIGTLGAAIVLTGVAAGFLPVHGRHDAVRLLDRRGPPGALRRVRHRESRQAGTGDVDRHLGDDRRVRAGAQLHGTGITTGRAARHEESVGGCLPHLDGLLPPRGDRGLHPHS